MPNSCKIPKGLITAKLGKFETCKPVTFEFIRNTEKSPFLGSRYGQDIEPHGKYILEKETDSVLPGWETGEITFDNPLVIPHKDTNQWKKDLVEVTGKKGKALSKHLVKLGFDGIITVNDKYTSEIISLLPFKQL